MPRARRSSTSAPFFSPLKKFWSGRRSKTWAKGRDRTLHVELLEDRTVPVVSATFNVLTQALSISGTADEDILVSIVGGAVKVNNLDPTRGGGGPTAPSEIQTITVSDSDLGNLIDLSSVTTTQFTALASVSINAMDGADTILGSDFDDSINAGLGNDSVSGGAGNDSLAGGDGHDLIHGNMGLDVADGGEGNDTIYGGAGADNIDGGEGGDNGNPDWDDIILGEEGDDILKAGRGNDLLIAGAGDDRLFSRESGNDILVGGDGADSIVGADGFDLLLDGDSPASWSDPLAAWLAIRAEWSQATNASSYVAAAEHILGVQPGGLNGSYLLNHANLADDNVADTLSGGAGLDWFLRDTSINVFSGGLAADEWVGEGANLPRAIDDHLAVVSGPTIVDIPVSYLLANDWDPNLGGGSLTVTAASGSGASWATGQSYVRLDWSQVGSGAPIVFSYSIKNALNDVSNPAGIVTVTRITPAVMPLFGDVNGDRLTDVIEFDPVVGQIRATIDGQASIWSTSVDTSVAWRNPLVGDFNGDGRADVAARHGLSGDWNVWTSTGTTLAAPSVWEGWNNSGDWQDAAVGDYDGDGRDDLFSFDWLGGEFLVALSNGTRFDFDPWGNIRSYVEGLSEVERQNIKFEVADFDGDGRDDVLVRNANGGSVSWAFVLSIGLRFSELSVPQTFATWTGSHYLGDFSPTSPGDELLGWNASANRWEYVVDAVDSSGRLIFSGTTALSASNPTLYVANAQVADINWDGRDDLVANISRPTITTTGNWIVLATTSSGITQATAPEWNSWLDHGFVGYGSSDSEPYALNANRQLNELLDSFSWVYNTIETEFYYGHKKGPELAQQTKAANALDQAILLVDTLRDHWDGFNYKVSQVLVETLNLSQVANWVGAYTSSSARARLERDSLVEANGFGNNEEKIKIRHAVAKVSLPVADGTSFAYVNFDPSWKYRQIPEFDAALISLLRSVEFGRDFTAGFFGLSPDDPTTPLEYWKGLVSAELMAQAGTFGLRSLSDVILQGPIRTRSFSTITDASSLGDVYSIIADDMMVGTNSIAPSNFHSAKVEIRYGSIGFQLFGSFIDDPTFDTVSIYLSDMGSNFIRLVYEETGDPNTRLMRLFVGELEVQSGVTTYAANADKALHVRYLIEGVDYETSLGSASRHSFEDSVVVGFDFSNFYTSSYVQETKANFINLIQDAYANGSLLDSAAMKTAPIETALAVALWKNDLVSQEIAAITHTLVPTAAPQAWFMYANKNWNIETVSTITREFSMVPACLGTDVPGVAFANNKTPVNADGAEGEWDEAGPLHENVCALELWYHSKSWLEHSVFEDLFAVPGASTLRGIQKANQTVGLIVTSGSVKPASNIAIGNWTGTVEFRFDPNSCRPESYWLTPRCAVGGMSGGGTASGARDDAPPPNPTPCDTCTQNPIDLYTGGKYWFEDDASIPGIGEDLHFERIYYSFSTADVGFGTSWHHNFMDFLQLDQATGDLTWHAPMGWKLSFKSDGQGGFTVPGIFKGGTFQAAGSGYQFTDRYGNVTSWDPKPGFSGVFRLADKRDKHGNGARMAYDPTTGNLWKILQLEAGSPANGGTRYIQLGWQGSQIASVTEVINGASGRQWTYTYANGRLVQVNRPFNTSVSLDNPLYTPASYSRFEYYNSTTPLWDGLLHKVFEPDPERGPSAESMREFTYYANRRAFQSIDPEGNVDSVEYDQLHREVTFIDPHGERTTYRYKPGAPGGMFSPHFEKIIHADGSTEAFEWSDGPRLTKWTNAFGQTVTYAYHPTTAALVTMTDNRHTTPITTTYAYTNSEGTNPFNEPVSMTTSAGVLSQQWLYDFTADWKNIESIIDPEGNMTAMTHYANGLVHVLSTPRETSLEPGDFTRTYTYHAYTDRVVSEVSALRTISATYDHRGNMLSSTDGAGSAGVTTTYAYDVLDRVRSVTTPRPDGLAGGAITQYRYNAAGDLSQMTDPLGRPTHFQYDTNHDLTTLVYADGTFEEFFYDERQSLVRTRDPKGRETLFGYDARGRRVFERDALGGGTAVIVDAEGRVVAARDKIGRVTRWKYDSAGRLLETRTADPDGAGTGNPELVWSYQYDPLGRLSSMTDPRGAVTELLYDNLDRVLVERVLDPSASDYESMTGFGYDPNGNLASVRLLDVTSVARASIDTLSELETWIAANPAEVRLWEYAFDTSDRLDLVTKPTGGTIDYAYNSAGRLSSISENGRTTDYAYNEAGWLKRVTLPDPDGPDVTLRSMTSWNYDLAGNITSVVDANSQTTNFSYDTLDRLVSQTLPDPDFGGPNARPTTRYGYDVASNLMRLTDPVNNTTYWTYDALDRVTKEKNATRGERSWVYDAENNVTSATDRRGYQTSFVYDQLDRVTEERWHDPVNPTQMLRTIAYAYSAGGDLLSASDPSASYTLVHDKLGRLTSSSVTNPTPAPNVQATYAYNALGEMAKSIFDDLTGIFGADKADFINAYVYDLLSRVESITQFTPQVPAAAKHVAYTYDPLTERVDTIRRYEGLSADPQNLVATTDFDYDLMGRVKGLQHFADADGDGDWDTNETRYAGYDYSHDVLSRITQIVSVKDGTHTFSYDATGQLTSYGGAGGKTHSFDENGNRRTLGYQTGKDNRLLADGDGTTYLHDAEGNVVRATYQDGSKVEYVWDHRGRMTQAKFTDASSVVTKTVNFSYDAFDRRIAKEVDLPGGSAVDEGEYFVYDGEDIALVFDELGFLTHRYMHGPGIDEVLADEVFSGGTGSQPHPLEDVYWTLPDHQGSIRDVLDRDGSTTSLVEHVVMDAWGNVINVKDGAGVSKATDVPTVRYAYTGREYDAETGLYYYRARYYDPATGRFLSTDPIGFGGNDANLYRYVGNGAPNFVDPMGLEEVSGFLVWLYTGDWTTEENVYESAIGGAASSLEEHLPAAHARLDVVAAIDPTGLADATNACLYVLEGDDEAAIAAAQNVVPGVGEAKKGRKALNGVQVNINPGGKRKKIPNIGKRVPNEEILKPPAKKGQAPIGSDGEPIELHHRDQTNDSILDEMTKTDHRGKGNFKKNHKNTGQCKSEIDRSEADRQREEHWKREWDNGRFDKNTGEQ